MQKERGITLIALIITIIVMLILVGVTVSVALNGGLFRTAKNAAIKTEISIIAEKANEKAIENKMFGNEDENITIEDLDIEYKTKEKYKDIFSINKDGTLEYDPYKVQSKEELAAIEELGLQSIVDYFNYSAGTVTGFSEKGKEAIENGKTIFTIPDKSKNGTTITRIQGFSGSKVEEIKMPNTVTSIQEGTFKYSCLEKIYLPNSLKSIGFDAFYCCTEIKGELLLPEGLTTIGYNAFRGCKNITKIVIPKSVTSIGADAFLGVNKECKIFVPFAKEEGAPEGWRTLNGGTIIYADEVEQ